MLAAPTLDAAGGLVSPKNAGILALAIIDGVGLGVGRHRPQASPAPLA
jgi:hypothetical protein